MVSFLVSALFSLVSLASGVMIYRLGAFDATMYKGNHHWDVPKKAVKPSSFDEMISKEFENIMQYDGSPQKDFEKK